MLKSSHRSVFDFFDFKFGAAGLDKLQPNPRRANAKQKRKEAEAEARRWGVKK